MSCCFTAAFLCSREDSGAEVASARAIKLLQYRLARPLEVDVFNNIYYYINILHSTSAELL